MRSLMLAVLLLASFASAGASIQPPKGIEGDEWRATFALYAHKGTTERFICTATAFKQVVGGYDLISAGHCVVESGAESFSVAEDLGGIEMPVTVVKSEMDKDADLAVFELKTDNVYPTVPLGTNEVVSIGDAVVNPNFSIGAAKQFGRGTVASSTIVKEERSINSEFFVHLFFAPGASGSAIISADTHHIIGILVDAFRDDDGLPVNLGAGVEPIDGFDAFLARPDKPKKASLPTMTAEEFNAKFGPKHTFKLTVHDPNPQFEIGGHVFKVDTFGMGLYDKYYYKAKVYIDRDGPAGFRLVSTKKPHFSVSATLQA